VLDLDETLVNVKISKTNSNQGCLLFRPGLDDFLEHLSEWYEIVIFTAATKDYADAILDEIDLNGNLFAYRLYREHTTIIGNDYVKDISLIGRDLDKTVIVDNMAQNFKLQKENGILIHSFWGDDEYDVALIELEKILKKVAQEKGDIRVILKKYKEDILKKVSSKLFWDNNGC
jgi:CTD small phosphatase-like protein 2